jgi:hypothetical protein
VIIEIKPELSLYPNPAISELKIKTEGISSSNAQLRIVNMNGITVMRSRFGSGTQSINIGSLPAGNYMLVIDNEGRLQSKVFVKL